MICKEKTSKTHIFDAWGESQSKMTIWLGQAETKRIESISELNLPTTNRPHTLSLSKENEHP